MDRTERAKEFLTKNESFFVNHGHKWIDVIRSEGTELIISYLYRYRDRPVFPGELAKASGVSTARIAALLKKLEDRALIIRTNCPEDSRKTVVELTEDGIKLGEEMYTAFLKSIGDILDYVGEKDMNDFLRIAGRINEAIGHICPKGGQGV